MGQRVNDVVCAGCRNEVVCRARTELVLCVGRIRGEIAHADELLAPGSEAQYQRRHAPYMRTEMELLMRRVQQSIDRIDCLLGDDGIACFDTVRKLQANAAGE